MIKLGRSLMAAAGLSLLAAAGAGATGLATCESGAKANWQPQEI